MSQHSPDMNELSLAELFRIEADGQLAILTSGLLALEHGDASQLDAMMRAAHSLKGAARIVGLDTAVQIAHAMEDCFVAAQNQAIGLGHQHIDRLLVGVDLLARISRRTEAEHAGMDPGASPDVDALLNELGSVLTKADDVPSPLPAGSVEAERSNEKPAPVAVSLPAFAEPVSTAPAPAIVSSAPVVPPVGEEAAKPKTESRVVRVSANSLNRLLALAGESLVESRRLRPFGASVARIKRLHRELADMLDSARRQVADGVSPAALDEALLSAQNRLGQCRDFLAGRLDELDSYDRQATNLAHRLYGEALAVRMRPFADGVGTLPRLARDLARERGKEVRRDILGEDTQVDRDILDKLDAPLGHLLRNAIDHGIERPAERTAAGKPAAGRITIGARHSAGVLLISIQDDGRGIDPEAIRATVRRKGLAPAEQAARMSESELLEFLFLPGFTLAETVTEISGRGVGLDAVQAMAKSVRGTVRVTTQPGRGARFQIQLPLTLSVVRALLVTIAGEPYAIPLGAIARTVRLRASDIASTQSRQHFAFDGKRLGLVAAHQVLGRPAGPASEDLSVAIVGEGEQRYGVVVDNFLGERELVVQPLDPRLGKVKDVAAAALMEDGTPVLILDAADFVRSVEKLSAGGALGAVAAQRETARGVQRKRVLVVDDSLTVRELERKLLEARGYAVEIAVDGMDGWNAARTGSFALVITDVDMPRLDGFEFTRLLKQDPKLRTTPVMIVSYKDREEDRRRGLDAGADYYLTKASFHDETMLQAVSDLIGGAEEALT